MHWTTDALQLKQVCECLKDILNQVWFRFEPTGVRLVNVDPEKIVSVTLEFWPPKDDYYCEALGLTFSCYVQTLFKLIRNVKAGDVATITDTNITGDLKIVITDKDSVPKQRILLNTLRDVMPEFHLPVHHYAVGIPLSTQRLYQIIHSLAGVARKLHINMINDTLTFEAREETGMTSSMSLIVPNNKTEHEISCCIITKYMEKFLKPSLVGAVSLYLDSRLPVKLVYTLPTGYLSISMAALA